MPIAIITDNVFEPTKNAKRFELPVNTSIAAFVCLHGVDMSLNCCVLNSRVLQEDEVAAVTLVAGDVLVVCPRVGYEAIIYAVVALVVAAAVYVLVPTPPTPNAPPEGDAAYTLRGQRNQARLGEPVEVHYGRVRHYMSYMAAPYNRYRDNDQFFFGLFCVGAGRYDIEAIQVEDTDIDDFEDIEYEVYQPYEKVKLFPTHVQTSAEVSDIELYAPNEEDHTGWSGPFVLNSAGTEAYKIQLDFICRQGLFMLTKKGALAQASVSITAEYRKIDDDGDPVGSWTLLKSFTRTRQSADPQRMTISEDVPLGRYEIRAKRTNDTDEDNHRLRDTVHWDGARAFCDGEQEFGNVTLIAIKAKATDNLNDNSQRRFNVVATRKLKVYDPGTETWSRQTTRNPVWAAINVLRSDYGKNLNKKFIDLDAFVALAEELESEGIKFDGTFDSTSTVWDALKTILSVARAVPIVPAGRISVFRDKPQFFPTLGFNGFNIGKDSAALTLTVPNRSDYDGIDVEYINNATWRRESVLCLVGTDRGRNPRKVKLVGVTNRNRAYRWGMYQRAVEYYQRTNFTFETGLEGGTAVYGDLVAVKHELLHSDDTFTSDTTGRLDVDAIVVTGGETHVTLPVLPVWESGETHRIALRDNSGAVRGPYTCTAHPSDVYTVVIASELTLEDFAVPDGAEQPTYWFGVSGNEFTLCKIVKLETAGEHAVRVTAVPYDDRIFAGDLLTAPDIDYQYDTPPQPLAPTVENLRATPFPDSEVDYVLSWSPAYGADYYEVKVSTDGTNYTTVATPVAANYTIRFEPGDVWVKVAAVGRGKGNPATWSSTISATTGVKPGVPQNVRQTTTADDRIKIEWDAEPLATHYKIRIYCFTLWLQTRQSPNNWIEFTRAELYARSQKLTKPFQRTFDVEVQAVNAAGSSEWTDPVSVSRPVDVPTNLAWEHVSGLTFDVSWDHPMAADFDRFEVWASSNEDFSGTPSLRGTFYDTSATITVAGTPRYWRVFAFDDWDGTPGIAQGATPLTT